MKQYYTIIYINHRYIYKSYKKYICYFPFSLFTVSSIND